jgi:hypothetical protein
MGQQQISMEEAFPTFQRRCRELFEANLLLQVQVDTKDRELAALQGEITKLKEGAGETRPASGGPDLAAVPPFPMPGGA